MSSNVCLITININNTVNKIIYQLIDHIIVIMTVLVLNHNYTYNNSPAAIYYNYLMYYLIWILLGMVNLTES